MALKAGISPFLWFPERALEAAELYVSVFPNSSIINVTEIAAGPASGAKQVEFQLDSLRFTAIDGGPMFEMSPAISLVVPCQTQEEIDHYWNALSEGGTEGFAGWLTDRFGLSWQILPNDLDDLMEQSPQTIMETLLTMTKIDMEKLRQAV